MTTIDASLPSSMDAAAPGTVRPVTLARVIRSEWIKLRTLRSTWWGLGAVIVLMVGVGALAAAVSTGSVATPGGVSTGPGGDDPLSTVLTGANLCVLLLGVLGALAGAREYGSRMITATVAAVPRRWPVVLAKSVVLAALVLAATLVGIIGAYAAGMAILSAGGGATVSLGDDGVLRTLFGMAGYLTAVALLGLGLGVLFRSVAASVGTIIGALLIVPALAGALLPDSWDTVLQVLPSNAAAAFTAVQSTGSQVLSPTGGALTLVAWVLAVLGGAVVSVVKRDV